MRRIFAGESVALHSQTGSGKTLAYMLPLLARLRRDPVARVYIPRQALIVCPSRELAMQSCEYARRLQPGSAAVVSGTRAKELRDSLLREPAPLGTVLAMHHPPVPAVLDLAASVELREQRRLAKVLRGTDVRAVIAGHLHYSTFATFAGIPVSVASSTCYAQDLTVPVGGTRPQDGAQSYNLVHLYDDTVVHSVVPVDVPRVLEYIDPAESQRRLVAADVRPFSSPSRAASPSDRVALSRR